MVNIIKQEVVIEESLKKKLELICEFSNTTLKIINGSIRKIDKTHLTYNEDLKGLNYQYEHRYNDLKEKTNYLINHLNKVFQKLPEFIKTIVDHLFNHSGLDLEYFKKEYDPEVKRKEEKRFKGFNLFNKKEIEKATKHLNSEMDEVAEDFYNTKKSKEKDDGLSFDVNPILETSNKKRKIKGERSEFI